VNTKILVCQIIGAAAAGLPDLVPYISPVLAAICSCQWLQFLLVPVLSYFLAPVALLTTHSERVRL